jgi:hypothetical protein
MHDYKSSTSLCSVHYVIVVYIPMTLTMICDSIRGSDDMSLNHTHTLMLSCAIDVSNGKTVNRLLIVIGKAISTIVSHNCARTQYTDLSVDVTNTNRACGGVVGVSPSTRYLQSNELSGNTKAQSATHA